MRLSLSSTFQKGSTLIWVCFFFGVPVIGGFKGKPTGPLTSRVDWPKQVHTFHLPLKWSSKTVQSAKRNSGCETMLGDPPKRNQNDCSPPKKNRGSDPPLKKKNRKRKETEHPRISPPPPPPFFRPNPLSPHLKPPRPRGEDRNWRSVATGGSSRKPRGKQRRNPPSWNLRTEEFRGAANKNQTAPDAWDTRRRHQEL